MTLVLGPLTVIELPRPFTLLNGQSGVFVKRLANELRAGPRGVSTPHFRVSGHKARERSPYWPFQHRARLELTPGSLNRINRTRLSRSLSTRNSERVRMRIKALAEKNCMPM